MARDDFDRLDEPEDFEREDPPDFDPDDFERVWDPLPLEPDDEDFVPEPELPERDDELFVDEPLLDFDDPLEDDEPPEPFDEVVSDWPASVFAPPTRLVATPMPSNPILRQSLRRRPTGRPSTFARLVRLRPFMVCLLDRRCRSVTAVDSLRLRC